MKRLSVLAVLLVLALLFLSGGVTWAHKTKEATHEGLKATLSWLQSEQNQFENEHIAWKAFAQKIHAEHELMFKTHAKMANKESWKEMEEKHEKWMSRYSDMLKRHAEFMNDHKAVVAACKEGKDYGSLRDKRHRILADYKIIQADHNQMIKTYDTMHKMHDMKMHNK